MNEATSDYIWINDELNNFNQIIPRRYTLVPVSYTHLTLPTTPYV